LVIDTTTQKYKWSYAYYYSRIQVQEVFIFIDNNDDNNDDNGNMLKQQETINQRSFQNSAVQRSGGISFMQHTAKVASAALRLLEQINESFVQ